jgi:hypothetical protein
MLTVEFTPAAEKQVSQLKYEPLKEPRRIPLAVKGKYAELIGWSVVDLEVEGYILRNLY